MKMTGAQLYSVQQAMKWLAGLWVLAWAIETKAYVKKTHFDDFLIFGVLPAVALWVIAMTAKTFVTVVPEGSAPDQPQP